ncbi:MAG: AraC family transcriptional regulator [Paenibacillus sp.]|nr:AraC family transcriptional regulator [Paenibacillus sp.]
MLAIDGRITEAMQVRFMHIKQYDLPHTWRIENRLLEYAVIWLIEAGALEIEADGDRLHSQAGDLLCLASGTKLSARAKTASLRILSLNYEAAFPLAVNSSTSTSRSSKWGGSLRLPLHCGPDTAAELAAVMRGMRADAAADTAGRPLLLQAGLLRLLGLMAVGREADAEAGQTDTRVREAIAHMTSRPGAAWTVQQLAEAVRISGPHLRKLFLRDTGLPPLQYLHQLKATMAMRRLAASSERVSEIGYTLGYADANYFARMFKKWVGLSPQEYRKQHRDWMQSDQKEADIN